ncbi:unnamed protein product [Parascedosporium putredinis]|uniref:Secreted protein n=1 Tax=Parascedosporium putredinis TaxID=1442378 RepID=A0A9P1M870_9PEZI|nr:unnamed protein product [Parascedosporium putredinis]CAI7989570.1 unnamed protein product [Parascedosporium putredinis]
MYNKIYSRLVAISVMVTFVHAQYPFDLPYFIPCDGPWNTGQACPEDSHCWNISFAPWAGPDWALCRPNSMAESDGGAQPAEPPPASFITITVVVPLPR